MNYEGLPFEHKHTENGVVRTFSESIDEHELKWHVDDEDREITVLHKTDWMLQMDDELPQNLIEGEKYYIPKGIYHRVIKGNGDLKISVSFP